MIPFLFDVDWEYDRYAPDADSLVRCLLHLRSNPELSVETVREPSHLVMILDVSGSMNEPAKFPYLMDALERMLSEIEDGTWLTLILFSTGAHVVCKGIPAAEARTRTAEILAAVNSWEGLFNMTNLSGALHLAIDSVRALQPGAAGGLLQRAASAIRGTSRPSEALVPRVYVLTDGHLQDTEACCALIPRLARLNVELNSFGFGNDFAFDSIKQMMSQCRGGTIKQILNTSDIRERFRRVVEVTARIVAQNVTLQLEYGPFVIKGDFFQHRPNAEIWPASSFASAKHSVIDIGILEAERDYVWALEARLPASVAPEFQMAKLRMNYRQGGEGRECSWQLVPPVLKGDRPPKPDEYIGQVFAELEGLRDNSHEAQIAAYEARIRICEMEGRDPVHIQALRQVLDELKRGINRVNIDEGLIRQSDVDLNTPFFPGDVEPGSLN